MIDKRVFAVWSPKPGTGTSFLTANLAKYSAMQGNLTGAIDLNRQYSSLLHLLNIDLTKNKSLRNALFSDSEREIITNFHENEKEQKYLFALGLNPNDKVDGIHELERKHIERLLKISKEKFNILFLDLPTSYMEFTSYVGWFFAEKIIVVIDNDVNTLFALRKYLEQFDELNLRKDKFFIVVNKDIGVIEKRDVESITGLKQISIIPFSKHIIKDMNEGRTIFDAGGSFKDRFIQKQIKIIYEGLIMQGYKEEINSKKSRFPFMRKFSKENETPLKVGAANE